MPDISPIIAILLSVLTGILSGFGIGGGTLLIVMLTLFFSAKQEYAQAINLCYFIPTAGTSLLFHGKGKLLDRDAVIWTGCFGMVLSAVSSFIASYIKPRIIELIFGAILMIIGISEVFTKSQPRRKSK